MKNLRHRWIIIAILLVVVLPAVCFLAISFVSPWSQFNCEHQDIDITTGRLRFTRYRLYCKVSERIEDSPLSKVLPTGTDSATKPEWRRVNTFAPGVRNSPHYMFHSASFQTRWLRNIWESHKLPQDVRAQTARHVLAIWQQGDGDDLADSYLWALEELMDESKHQRDFSSLLALTMPLVETEGTTITRTVFLPSGRPLDRIQGYLDPSGRFVKHGIWERWYSDGTRYLYGHFENGEHHSRRFEWYENGKLWSIKAFNRDQLSECEYENLEQHPDYKVAQQIHSETARQPIRLETNQPSPAADSPR